MFHQLGRNKEFGSVSARPKLDANVVHTIDAKSTAKINGFLKSIEDYNML
jgi:hypothetical protein